MAFDYRDGYGNCPPGYYRPAPMYDCRPQGGGQVAYQQDLQKIAAQYQEEAQEGGAGGSYGTGASTGSPPLSYYQQREPVSYAPAPISSGGDNTMLLLIAAVALVFVMKK